MSSFEFHMQLGVQQQKAKVFIGHHLTSMSGLLFQQEQNKLRCRNVRRRSLPWVGQTGWAGYPKHQNSATKI